MFNEENINIIKPGDVLLFNLNETLYINKYINVLSSVISKQLQSMQITYIQEKLRLDSNGKIMNFIVEKIFPFAFSSKMFSGIFRWLIKKWIEDRYVHQEIYVGNGWFMGITLEGLYLHKLSVEYIILQGIYRCPVEYNEQDLIDNISSFSGVTPDLVSQFVNFTSSSKDIAEFAKNIIEHTEYDTPRQMSSAEIIQRQYKKLGIDLFPNPELVTFEDIQNKFIKIK